MLIAKTLQPIGERSGPEIRTTTHHQPGWLAPGVGIDYPDSTVFFCRHCFVISIPIYQKGYKKSSLLNYVGTCRILWIQYAIVNCFLRWLQRMTGIPTIRGNPLHGSALGDDAGSGNVNGPYMDKICDIVDCVDEQKSNSKLDALDMHLETTSESAIPRQSLTSAVADKLRDQIIRGEIPEGAQLRQDAIASQFQVSRIPVREALRQLDAEGLIAIVPNRGAIVPALSPDDIEELFSIRALLEPEVLKLSIPHLTEDDFSEADAVLRKYVSELQRDDHVSAWGRLNWQFHSILYSRANQPRFMAIIRNVNNNGERYTRLQLYLTHGMQRANEEHHQILDFCRQRDVTQACKLLRRHIQYAGESLKQALEQKRNDARTNSGDSAGTSKS